MEFDFLHVLGFYFPTASLFHVVKNLLDLVKRLDRCMEQTWDVKPVPERKLQDMLDLSGEQTLG